jgi:hypothetical protein
MTVKRLTIVVGIVSVGLVLGILSVNAEMHATTAVAAEGLRDVGAGSSQAVEDMVVLEAELLPNRQPLILFPQTRDALVCERDTVAPGEGAFAFKDGRIYTWANGERQQVWLFAVVARDKPNVRVDP